MDRLKSKNKSRMRIFRTFYLYSIIRTVFFARLSFFHEYLFVEVPLLRQRSGNSHVDRRRALQMVVI